jgi:hypothetical protein
MLYIMLPAARGKNGSCIRIIEIPVFSVSDVSIQPVVPVYSMFYVLTGAVQVQADGNFLPSCQAEVVDGSNFCTVQLYKPPKKNFKFKCPFVPNTAFAAQVLSCFVKLPVVDIFVDVYFSYIMRWRHLFDQFRMGYCIGVIRLINFEWAIVLSTGWATVFWRLFG